MDTDRIRAVLNVLFMAQSRADKQVENLSSQLTQQQTVAQGATQKVEDLQKQYDIQNTALDKVRKTLDSEQAATDVVGATEQRMEEREVYQYLAQIGVSLAASLYRIMMGFFLGWAMKRGQMSNPFLSRHREVVEAVWAGKGPDLRAFILNKLDGKLSTQFFDRRGSGFAQWYAQDNRSNPYIYRRDCRNIVLAESKDRVWNSIAEKDAAYLLLPYTEKSRQRVEQLLDERYQQYLEAEFADDPEKRVARAAEGKPAVIPDWDGPLFCYASDRVAQDGCKVQIMDRLFPEREDMGWESGWAFYSGDEGDVYGEGDEYYESHCGFYDIRDICRIDPDIIPLLNLPYGTMQMRGEDGAWYEVIRDDEGEEET